jgi:hypothetical protein
MSCSTKEREIRRELPSGGSSHEGCGFVPMVEKKVNKRG